MHEPKNFFEFFSQSCPQRNMHVTIIFSKKKVKHKNLDNFEDNFHIFHWTFERITRRTRPYCFFFHFIALFLILCHTPILICYITLYGVTKSKQEEKTFLYEQTSFLFSEQKNLIRYWIIPILFSNPTNKMLKI